MKQLKCKQYHMPGIILIPYIYKFIWSSKQNNISVVETIVMFGWKIKELQKWRILKMRLREAKPLA